MTTAEVARLIERQAGIVSFTTDAVSAMESGGAPGYVAMAETRRAGQRRILAGSLFRPKATDVPDMLKTLDAGPSAPPVGDLAGLARTRGREQAARRIVAMACRAYPEMQPADLAMALLGAATAVACLLDGLEVRK